jgi:ABC-2 type transport system permease protein
MTRLLRLDAVQLLRERLAVGVLVAGLLASLVAALTGMAWDRRLAREVATVHAEAERYRAAERENWAGTADPAAAAVLPGRLVTTLVLGRPPLADFVAGRSAIEPSAAAVRMGTRPDAMFARYQVENPERLQRGALDLGFVAVVVAPLLLIGLGYGVFVADRESGTARLWLAQAVRSANRLALVITPLLVGALLLWLAGPAGRGGAILAWLAAGIVGLLFWWAAILLVNTLAVAAETAALILVGSWAALVFVAPVAVGAAAALANPPPSRFEAIAVARAAEIRANRSYDDDHPELSSATLEGRRASVLKGVEVRRSVARALAPLEAERARQVAAQRRFADRLALLSPPMLVADALAGVAGTDAAAYAARRDAAAWHLGVLSTALAGAALGERPVDAATFDALPRFRSPPLPATTLGSMLWVLALTLGLGGLALARLRRIRPL